MPNNIVKIPILCPRCYGKLVAVRYEVTLKLLKERCWHICRDCGFERDVDEFKRDLFST